MFLLTGELAALFGEGALFGLDTLSILLAAGLRWPIIDFPSAFLDTGLSSSTLVFVDLSPDTSEFGAEMPFLTFLSSRLVASSLRTW